MGAQSEKGRGGFISRNLPLILILLVAAILRAVVLAEHLRLPIFACLRIDEAEYDMWAQDAVSGFLFPDTIANHGPGYPWLLAILYAVFGRGLLLPRLAQMALGLASVVLVHRIAARLAGPAAALVSALLFGLYWPQVIFEQRILDATLFTFLNLAWLFLAMRAGESRSGREWGAAGLLLGAAAIVRPTPLLLLLALAVWLVSGAARRRNWKQALHALIFTGACLLVLLPVLIGERAATGRWTLVQSEGGLNFYIGNNPASDGTPYARPGGAYDALQALPVDEAGIWDPAGQDRFYISKALEFMRQDPAAFIALQVRKAALLVNRREIRATISPEFQRNLFPALALPLPGFGILLALALPGLLLLRLSRRDHLVLTMYLLGYAAFTVATVVSSRYRMPFAAGLAILSGGGAARILAALALIGKRIRGEPAVKLISAAAPSVLLALGLALAYLPVAPAENEAEEFSYLGDAWQEQGNPERALQSYQKALSLDPNLAESMMGMSRLGQEQSDIEAAIQWMRKATEADPQSGAAHHELGLLLWQAGERERALHELELTVRLKPQWLPGYNDLARRELELGRREDAISRLQIVLRMYPDFAELKTMIEKLQQQSGEKAPPGEKP